MRRAIIDYKKLDKELAALLIDSYPHGYGDDDIILLKKPNGELIEAVEIRTDDTMFLVKISKSLSNFIANFEENIEKEIKQQSTSKDRVLSEDNTIQQINDTPLHEEED